MNEWTEKSIEIANMPGYLDRLSQIYPATLLPKRPLDDQAKKCIRTLYGQKKAKELIIFLFGLTRQKHPFPIEHPYASIFRQKPQLIDNNPEVFTELEKIILSMPVEDVIKGCERPIDINRVMGQAFHNWLTKYFQGKVPILAINDFDRYTGRAFLKGRDAEILAYVDQRIGISINRGRDFLYKTENKFVIGEARFLSTSGGSQTRDLQETISFIRNLKGKMVAVGVIDGIVWFNNAYVDLLGMLNDDEPALTVLLLEEYLKSL
jgi:hypothetical protein